MNRSFLSFLFLWMGLSLPLSRAATPNEQAEAFFARGLAAEQRGDFIVADHCLELTLRANPGHAQAQTKLKELEARQDTWTEEKARKVVLNHFKVDISEGQHPPIRESNLRRMWDEITRESGIPVIFENDGQDVGRINFDLNNVAVAEVLEKIAEQTRFDLTYERRAIRFSPKAIELTDETAKANSRRMVRFEGVVKRIDGNNGDHIWIRFEGAETYLFSGAEHYRQVFGPTDQEFPIKPGQRLRARGRIILDKGIPYIRLAAASQWEIIASDDALANPSLLKPADAPPAPKPSLTSVAPFAPGPSASTPAMPQKEAVPPKETAMPFRDWLATVKFEQRSGDSTLTLVGEQWRVEQNKAGKTFLYPIVSIEEATRTITWRFPDGKVRFLQVGEGRDEAVQKDGAQFKVEALAPGKPTEGNVAGAIGKPALTPGQPDPKTDFKGWLKTVQFKHGNGDGVIWSFEDGVVLHYSRTDPNPKVQRFGILSIDPETRTVAWRQPGADLSIRIGTEFRKYEWKGKDKPFVPQPLAIEPRDPAIFGPSPAP